MTHKILLDYIARFESRGNYNAYFAHGKNTEDISGNTVDGILNWMGERVRAGAKSSATGRYQFIKKTLIMLKEQMNLSGKEKFTPELQDELALQLLKNRGYLDYMKGKISANEFGHRLACEWASLPSPKLGHGVYDGDGLNRSLTSVADFLAVLRKVKEAPEAPEATRVPKSPEKPASEAPRATESRSIWAILWEIFLKLVRR
jgi:hypothetical protein